jgi:WD40 repeat protein
LLAACALAALPLMGHAQPALHARPPDVVANIGHSDSIRSVAISRDGKLALTGSNDKTLRLWEAATGRLVRTFQGHRGYVNSVAISPDERMAASGSTDGVLIVWDLSTGSRIRSMGDSPEQHGAPVATFDTLIRWMDEPGGVAFSPDGRLVLSAVHGKVLKLWDIETGNLVGTFTGHGSTVSSVAFSSDGRRILSGSSDNTVILWSTEDRRAIHIFSGHESQVTSVAFSPNSRLALSASKDKTVKLWDVESGELLRTMSGACGGC